MRCRLSWETLKAPKNRFGACAWRYLRLEIIEPVAMIELDHLLKLFQCCSFLRRETWEPVQSE